MFGPIHVEVEGQSMPRLRSRKALWVLALLSLRHGREVDRQWLAATLWPEVDSSQGLANLRPTLSELRRALGGQAYRVRVDGRLTVSLDLDGADLDLREFDELVIKGGGENLERAVELYRGTLLEGCAEEWIFQDRDAREQDCLRILQKLADDCYSAKDYPATIAHCRRAIGVDPLRDAPRRRLMEALQASGDRNAALHVFREFADLLRKELGASPDEATSDLYLRIRKVTRKKNAADHAAVEVKDSRPTSGGNVPTPISSLIGREDECIEVASRLRRSRLVTLTGPGGIGKTRLAIEVATASGDEKATYPDGVWMVALESLTDPDKITVRIMEILDLREEPGRDSLATLVDHLRRRRLLILLDNCEHLLASSAKVADFLLRSCPGLKILATSREALGIVGEAAWTLPTLSTPDPAHLPDKRSTLVRVIAGYESVELFVDRARAVQQTFELTVDNAPFIAQICYHLDGLPLALELAAARARSMTVAEIASRLDERFSLFTRASSSGMSRQQTLRASLDWSYTLLNDAEKSLLRRLSVFVGGWTLEGAKSICSGEDLPEKQILDLLASLIDKSLVVFSSSEAELHGTKARYRLLESVRQYAADLLYECGEDSAVRSKRLTYFRGFVAEVEPLLTGPEQQDWLERLEAELANLRAALDWADGQPEERLRLAGDLGRFWEVRGYYSEARSYLSRLLAETEALGANLGRAKALRVAGAIAYYQGEHAEARSRQGQALEMSRELGDNNGTAWALNELADVLSAQGDAAGAKPLYEESLAIFRELGDRVGIASLVHHLGRLVRDHGDYPEAQRWYDENLALQQELGNEVGVAWALHHLGNLALLRNDPSLARSIQTESLELFRRLGVGQGVAWTLSELGLLSEAEGDPETAEGAYMQSVEIFREMGNVQGVGAVLQRWGRLAFDQGDLSAARERLQQSLGIWSSIGTRIGVAECLSAIAEIEAAEGQWRKAVRFWGAADSMRKSASFMPSPAETRRAEHHMERPRRELGEDKFSAAWLGVMALTMDQVVAEAGAPPASIQ
jgi:predicted ATPase/DNA-binding SARP family transcriptional activator